MAATPTIPPGANHFQLNGNSPQQQQPQQDQQQQQQASNNNTPNIVDALQQHFHFKALLNADEDQQQQQQQQLEQQEQQRNNSNISSNSNISRSSSYEQLEESACRPKAKLSCQCTNISIMHLFHEMKQEFPTLPDALVTQCVNENCHQRDNCIQMLKKELVLHPSPVQSYPAKVVQQQQHLQQQQRQAKPPTPLKPSRAAPTQPPASGVETPSGTPIARTRPTTLNLPRQLNAQLQQKIQQRQEQQQQQRQQKQQQESPPRQQQTPSVQYKPLRRAPPLPPLPPKPLAVVSSSCSNDSSCLTSPLSSSESELSLNVSLSSPTIATTTATATATATVAAVAVAASSSAAQSAAPNTAQLRSPVRHRSVITLQPEPPYAREFLSNAVNAISPSPAPTPPSPTSGGSTPSGRKSFTSLNLTLRQPQISSNGAAPSTIDITAGPAASGNGSSGITYSSSSFDARRGTHKNFQLTVTDEGSVFSAGCVRPQVPLYAPCPPPPTTPPSQPGVLVTDGATPTPTARQQQQQQQQQLQQQLQEQAVAAAAAAAATATPEMQAIFPYPTQAQNHIVASNYNNNHLHNSNSSDNSPSVTHMPLYEGVVPESDREAHAKIIERQKMRRDKLANALRENKKRLLMLEQEINILTEPVPVGESERLDREIKKLTEDCQRLLNDPQLNGSAAAPNSMNRQLSAPTGPQQQQQPFPRQRVGPGIARTQMPPTSLQLHSLPPTQTQSNLDFVQHHSSAPSSACLSPQQQQLLQMELEPPPTYAQYYQFQQFLQQQRAAAASAAAAAAQPASPARPVAQPRANQEEEEEESLSESEVDEGEEPLDMWACNMCTFRNHPQLNICEACENVRIQPGMIRIVPKADDNVQPRPRPQQQMQPEADANRQQSYALHT